MKLQPSDAPISWIEARALRLFIASRPGDLDSGFGVARDGDEYHAWHQWRFAREGATIEAVVFRYSPPPEVVATFERLSADKISFDEIKRVVRRMGFNGGVVREWLRVERPGVPTIKRTRHHYTHTCAQCGVSFDSTLERKVCCSIECNDARFAAMRLTKRCAQCAKDFRTPPSQAERVTCSAECTRAMVRARKLERKRLRRLAGHDKGYDGDDRAEVIARLTNEQGGRCATCGKTPDRLVLDHCHDTGRARALLCGGCNTALGMSGEDASRLRSIALYAEAWGARRDDPPTIAAVRDCHAEGWTFDDLAEAAGVSIACVERWLQAI